VGRHLAAFAIAMYVGTTSAAAHHAISAFYDNSKRATVQGVVSQFRFVSPHPMVIVDVVDGGVTRQWRLEMDNRSELAAIGIGAETLKAGDGLVVSGSLARDGSKSLYVLTLSRPSDGFSYEQVGGRPRIVRKPASGD
jgi:hypothetical protein